ncbi:MAG: S49 family peptidase, partial [Planctomyces sp.]
MLRSVTFGVFLFGGLVVSGSIFGNASAAVIADDTAGAKPASPETAAAESTDQKSDQKKADAETPAKKVRVDWARIVIEGGYPESRQMPGLFGDLTESLGTCLERLDQAAKDKAIRGVILDIRGVSFGWGRLHEIQTGILSLRNAGKPVWAVMTDASMKEYLLAASCDRIIVPETSTLMLLGLRAEVTFYRNLFENLQIKADMLRVGAFKSAAEPYNRSEMSPEFRQEMEELLDDYYGSILKQISTARKLTEDKVREIIDEGMLPATRAKDLGLIDELAYDDQLMELIR